MKTEAAQEDKNNTQQILNKNRPNLLADYYEFKRYLYEKGRITKLNNDITKMAELRDETLNFSPALQRTPASRQPTKTARR